MNNKDFWLECVNAINPYALLPKSKNNRLLINFLYHLIFIFFLFLKQFLGDIYFFNLIKVYIELYNTYFTFFHLNKNNYYMHEIVKTDQKVSHWVSLPTSCGKKYI